MSSAISPFFWRRAEIEALYAGPYAELFARQRRPGWDAWGNEVDKFGPDLP